MLLRRGPVVRTVEGWYLAGEDAQNGFDDGGLADAGPPVITSTLDIKASRIAATWLRQGRATHASACPDRSMTKATAICQSLSRSAMLRSARYRPARNTQGVSPTGRRPPALCSSSSAHCG